MSTRMTLGGLGLLAILTAGTASAQIIDEPFVCDTSAGQNAVDSAFASNCAAARVLAEEKGRRCQSEGRCSGFEEIACRGPVPPSGLIQARICLVLMPRPQRDPSECQPGAITPECAGDPVLFDFGERGFDLTGVEQGVEFDIDADGALEKVAWTAAGADDSFLALDRNANGKIDDGNELFGNVTLLGNGRISAHGFEALAELDLAVNAGNGNGYVDRLDHHFGSLLLWTDRNHDGRSAVNELVTLAERRIVAIKLSADESDVVDEYGNHLAYVSSAYALRRSGVQRIRTTDIFFQFRELAP
jgi:hypothetical protein